ncbi:hypothetical protein M3Y95_00782000 [Aphelenchoides besseyi]|nr:hypothetical protein M3Y95_00782000 [Aphelenchoides besseyi]
MSTKLQLQGLGRLLETSGGRISVDGIAADAPATSKQCVYKSNDSAVMYRHQGNDPRFLVHDGRVPYVVDTSDGMKTLPFKLHYPTVRNNRLFGFRRGVREVDTTKLVEVSLTDGTKMEREIKNRDYLQINTNPFTYAWSKNTLFAVHFDQNSDLSTIVRFDLRELKWTTTNMEVKGTASELSIAGCVLTVSSNAVIGDEPEDHYYQFHMNKVDSFANLIWRSVHQYTHSNPLFTEWFVSKLPINSRFRQ